MDGELVAEGSPPTENSVPEKITGKASGMGALMGGLLASSCCILPLAMVSVGIGGAWMSNLTALSPYQPIFLTLAAASVGYGFWKARVARRAVCATDGACARPINSKLNTVLLWIGGVLAVTAFAITLAAPLLY